MKLDQLLGEVDSKFDNLGSKLASLEIKSSNHKWENEEQKMIICSQIDNLCRIEGEFNAKVSSKIDKVVAKLDNVTGIVENDYRMTSSAPLPVTQPGASPSAESSEGQGASPSAEIQSSEGQAPIRLIV